ncbi:MAG TPA: hypothetical protein VF485_01815 [Sphingomonas sp.]
MGFLISLALGWKWPDWAARLFGWAVPILVAIAAAGAMVALIYHRGETAGGAKVQMQAETAHARTVAAARADERQAQATVDAIGSRVAVADGQTATLVRSRIVEIHDALDATPAAVPTSGNPAASAAPFDAGRVRASLNAVVADANRAAEAADAER